MKYRLLYSAALVLVAIEAWGNSAPWVGNTLNGLPCQGKKHGYGPFDYTQRALEPSYHLEVVENRHFTAEVENLISGNTSSTPEGDIAYTLGAWPNHHRALLSIINYQLKIKNKLIKDKLSQPPECYLQRAIYFSPKDAVSYSLYGYYLRKMGHLDDAIKFYQKAIEIEPENSKINYSFSLLLIDVKRYKEAVEHAKVAYKNDSSTPQGLKQKLIKLGQWEE